MTNFTIASVDARPIVDSRAHWTVEALVELSNGVRARASVPRGKSAGSHEAVSLDARAACEHIRNEIAAKLRGADPMDQAGIDAALLELDGTPDKSRLGGNAILAVSFAIARVAATAQDVPLWRHLHALYGGEGPSLPKLYMNMINGGVHAGNGLSVQEFLLIPQYDSVHESIELGMRFYDALRGRLQSEYGASAVNLGDEGGFAPDMQDDLEPLRVMRQTAQSLGVWQLVRLGIDAAASSMQEHEDLATLYRAMKTEFDMRYIEDPFGEEDFDAFAALLSEMGDDTLICGDDLTTTNVERMQIARGKDAINSMIIKPNQIATLTETLAAVRLAREWGWSIVVSHRSGETDDDFVADLAYAVGADGFKLGAPARGERVAKYNRLLAIENSII